MILKVLSKRFGVKQMNENQNYNVNLCVCCGTVIPEGTMVCYECKERAPKEENANKKKKPSFSQKSFAI